MTEIKFKNYTAEVKAAIGSIMHQAVEEVCGELESQVKQNTVVDTSQTKNSWTHQVTTSSSETVGTVGSPLQNAIWEELGTGEYALNGDGRKGGWAYKDPKTGDTIWTRGKHPRRPFWKAYTTLKTKLIKHMQDRFKGGLS